MTWSEFSAVIGVLLVSAVLTIAVWRQHGVAGLRRAVPGLLIALVAVGMGLVAGRLIGPGGAGLVMVLLLVGALAVLNRVAPGLSAPPPEGWRPVTFRNPRLVAIVVGIGVAVFLFAVPGRASPDPINIGLAGLMGAVAAVASYLTSTRIGGA